jgi:Abnormal spindle-like microcephaly-assoc'd, ASPM-SPD-2-Hydin
MKIRLNTSLSWSHGLCACLALTTLAFVAMGAGWAQEAVPGHAPSPIRTTSRQSTALQTRVDAPRVMQARRFLAERGWTPGRRRAGQVFAGSGISGNAARAQTQNGSAAAATWQPIGPAAVLTPNYGLVTGRISTLALDPANLAGNRLYVGTTGGGVWVSQNAVTSNPSNVVFVPLTDNLDALGGITDASISIGALTVQPGGTGVILAGTGDPNDALDSYYGAGILRSADGGNNWNLVQFTADGRWGFGGEGFAGFAWSTTNPRIVVAAVSQAYEGTLIGAERAWSSYEGMYFSTDSGTSWNLATITDDSGADVQGPNDAFTEPDGNAATSVVWNPVRQLFVAAVRFHGYYQSSDGVTWTRMVTQPGLGLTQRFCPTNSTVTGSIDCPIFRGSLAVNPQTGDTFAWTVDLNNQDQGLWQDECQLQSGVCGNQTITFARQWNTAALETNTREGPATIAGGDYTLALTAMPAGPGPAQDTLLFAGANDLWKCSLAMGCVWRNTTNADSCMSAQVPLFQHALAWNATNPLEMFVGNDSGLWRSLDAIGETGPVCSSTDASHFQNLNGSLGSLAEVVSLSAINSLANSAGNSAPGAIIAGFGVNGTAATSNDSGTTMDWAQILGGNGGPVAIDPVNNANWYVNAEEGVSIYLCPDGPACTSTTFGSGPVVTDADVDGDGLTMTTPAPFLVDMLDSTQLLIGTCRVWRGPANGSGWGASNAISPVLDTGATRSACNGDALIRTMAAMSLGGGNEVIYVGMFGAANGGANLPGHVLSAIINPASGQAPQWQDLTLNPVTNWSQAMNAYSLDISSIFIDPHDPTGNTVYVTVAGIPSLSDGVKVVYRSVDGGAHWASLISNLPWAPANSIIVDPQDAATVYIATDVGVYFTTNVANCAALKTSCWSRFGTGLPGAPVTEIGAQASTQTLVAATYGRGIWQSPLWTASAGLTAAVANPASLTFTGQVFGTASSAQTLTVTNTGGFALMPTTITMSGDFIETDNCQNATVPVGESCSIQVVFTPTETGSRIGQLVMNANVYGGQLTVDLSGTGTPAGAITVTPATLSFGDVQVGTASTALQVEAGNSSGSAIAVSSVTASSPFTITSDMCSSSNLGANSECQVKVGFAPSQTGAVAGTLTFTDGAGTQTVALSGTGAAAPTDILGASLLAFPNTTSGLTSSPQTVNLTNTGGLPLTSIAISASGPFLVSSSCGTELAAGSLCTISVTFAPVSAGALTGTLTVSDVLRTQTVALAGTGIAEAALSVSPTSLSFGAQQVGGSSAPAVLTVSNSGGVSMSNVGFQISGASADSFATGTTTCGATLANGSNCTVKVIFTPVAAGGSTATLTVSSSSPNVAPVSVPLSGAGGTASGINVTPSAIVFPATAAGQVSSAITVTVTNTGSLTSLNNLALTVPPGFLLGNSTCTATLGAGASCSVGVEFDPAAAGQQTGVFTVTSSSVPAGAEVSLAGMGFDFTLTASGAVTQTIAGGQTASYALVIAPMDGAQGIFTFQCGTLPANTLCLFTPTSETIGAGDTGKVSVQIFTDQSGAGDSSSGQASLRNVGISGRSSVRIGWAAVPIACGLILLPLSGTYRRRKNLWICAIIAILIGVSSCTSSSGGTGGGGGGGGGTGSTPSGTYSIPITVTSTGIAHSMTITLKVN